MYLPAVFEAFSPANWLQFDYGPEHSGNNPDETIINASDVASLAQIFQVALPGVADGAPVYLAGVATSSGVRDLLFVTTKGGTLAALDAHSGALIWSAPHPAGQCVLPEESGSCFTTSSPAIDPNLQFVYSYGLDGRVHKHAVGDGTEVTSAGWPEPVTLKPGVEKGSSALAIAVAAGTSFLYVANGGYPGDRGDYQGHLTTINLATGAQSVFDADCSDQSVHFALTPDTPDCSAVQSAIWARPGVVYDPETGHIYAATGNGSYVPASHDWGDSVFALNPDGTGAGGGPLDSYTPVDQAQLDTEDLDLGSTAPALLPTPAASVVKHLALQGGKDGLLRLLNLDNLSGQGGPGHTGGELQVVPVSASGGLILPQPAVWVNPADGSTWAFVAHSSGLTAAHLNISQAGAPALQVAWQLPAGCTSPVVANNVLFCANPNLIHALDPTTGNQLWASTTIGGIHWESPIVVNGNVYITDESGNLTDFGLPAPGARHGGPTRR